MYKCVNYIVYNICAVSKKSLVTYAEFPREEFGKTSRGKFNNVARKNLLVFPKCETFVGEIFFIAVEQTILLFVIIACAYYFKDVFLGPPLRR